MGTGFGCRLEGMETMFVSYCSVTIGPKHVVVKHIVKYNTIIFVVF